MPDALYDVHESVRVEVGDAHDMRRRGAPGEEAACEGAQAIAREQRVGLALVSKEDVCAYKDPQDMVRTWLALQSRLQLLGRERLQLISRRVSSMPPARRTHYIQCSVHYTVAYCD